ncbi:MAG TPA: 2-oxoglutarate dehydrogenase, E2 component, dihydrolipoamide succinyltransferase [Streptosporangiaceae bacterium]|nr:2-oxoglutarate dehydrogenase, E2 component, dihydrolipoamide succinyltransferase [Streptosporangiaceae bacterium]
MSVSVSMPQLGESVTEGTVTRWLKKEGERVEADEPLLEVSTDKVDTEIPSPVAGILRGITVAEDETVAVGAELAIIDETGAEGQAAEPPATDAPAAGPPATDAPAAEAPAPTGYAPAGAEQAADSPPAGPDVPEQAGYPYPDVAPAGQPAPAGYQQPAAYQPPGGYGAPGGSQPGAQQPGGGAQPRPPAAPPGADVWQRAEPVPPPPPPAPPAPPAAAQAQPGPAPAVPAPADGPYVTPLVRKLAADHGVDLGTVAGTGVGGRIRKQDVIDASRARREAVAAAQQAAAPDGQAAAVPAAGPAAAAEPLASPAQLPPQRATEPSGLRGRTERMSRARQLIARRMVESLQTSAQLTTVIEVDVTAIARLRDRARADFEGREGVKLSFLPFFALAAIEALKVHPRLNASIEPDGTEITYHDAEHLGIAVDTERGLMVPVIRNAGDLNVGGLARKIADLAARTRAGQVSPDDLAGGTFTLTNTGSRGALFDTPIINQPQVGILGTGSVVRRPVVVRDRSLGEVIAVRSMVYLALSYDHRLVDGADAARFLGTVQARLEEGAFEAELGL